MALLLFSDIFGYNKKFKRF